MSVATTLATVAMTLPVAVWCAWPFHRKAVIAARHGGSSMDTLVSLGIVAASGWSMYTIFHDHPDPATHSAWGLVFQPAPHFAIVRSDFLARFFCHRDGWLC